MPAPPSVVALPPTPNTMVVAPASSAAASSSPEPYVVAVSGANTPSGRCWRPEASAISTTAVEPRSAYAAVTGSPTGPVTRASRRSNPAATAAATVPSPPSATGRVSTSRPGTTRRSPAVTRSATCTAVSEPLNLSAATSTRAVSTSAPSVTLHPLLSNRQSRRPDPIRTPPHLPWASTIASARLRPLPGPHYAGGRDHH